jgi:hypothetical protein
MPLFIFAAFAIHYLILRFITPLFNTPLRHYAITMPFTPLLLSFIITPFSFSCHYFFIIFIIYFISLLRQFHYIYADIIFTIDIAIIFTPLRHLLMSDAIIYLLLHFHYAIAADMITPPLRHSRHDAAIDEGRHYDAFRHTMIRPITPCHDIAINTPIAELTPLRRHI